MLNREWRSLSRNAPAPFYRLQQRGLLAAHKGTRATEKKNLESRREDVEQAVFAKLSDHPLQHGDRLRILLADVDDRTFGLNHTRRNQDSLQNSVRVGLQQHPIHECARIALVGVADDDLSVTRCLVGKPPFFGSREPATTASAKLGLLEQADNRLWREVPRLFKSQQPSAFAIIVDRFRRRNAAVACHQTRCVDERVHRRRRTARARLAAIEPIEEPFAFPRDSPHAACRLEVVVQQRVDICLFDAVVVIDRIGANHGDNRRTIGHAMASDLLDRDRQPLVTADAGEHLEDTVASRCPAGRAAANANLRLGSAGFRIDSGCFLVTRHP